MVNQHVSACAVLLHKLNTSSLTTVVIQLVETVIIQLIVS